MGYETCLSGDLEFDRRPDDVFLKYLERFLECRHVKRDTGKIKEVYPDWYKMSLRGDLGEFGELFADFGDESMIQKDVSVMDQYGTPGEVPSQYCDYTLCAYEDRVFIRPRYEYDYVKSYYYTEWLVFIIEKIIKPSGYKLNGVVLWDGEASDDYGRITVIDNEVRVGHGVFYYDDDNVGEISSFSTEELVNELIKRGFDFS